MMNQHRIEQLMKSMEKEHLPQLLLCDPHTIAYLTDDFIDPGERFLGLLLRHGQPPILFLNRLFTAPHTPAEQIIYYDDTQRGAVLASSFTDPTTPLGVDKNLRAEFLLELQEQNAASCDRNGSPAAAQICTAAVLYIKNAVETHPEEKECVLCSNMKKCCFIP